MDSKKILTHLIRAGRNAQNMENILHSFGYKETPYFDLYGDIAEAIYALLGEQTDSFDESVTYAIMNDPITSDEDCAEHLAPMVTTNLDIPDSTMEILTEGASERNVDLPTMINMILGEWAMKKMYANSSIK